MGGRPTRRRWLRLAGAAGATALAGCTQVGSRSGPPSVTPAPVPTDPPTTTPPPTTGEPPGLPAVRFDVEALRGFDREGPGRVAVTFENAGERRLTVVDRQAFAVPFADDDYVGTSQGGNPVLLIVPDGTLLRVAPGDGEPAPLAEVLPDEPVDGCWRVPFDWPADRVEETGHFHAITVSPGSSRRHEYALYYLEGCSVGTFAFEHTFELNVGEGSVERQTLRARLGFRVDVAGGGHLQVYVEEPGVVRTAEGGRASPG